MTFKRRKATGKKATRRHQQPSHQGRPSAHLDGRIGTAPIRGLVFDLCCGDMGIANGVGHNRGEYKIRMEAHGFELTILLGEEQAENLGKGLTACVTEAKKGVS